jgi:acyl-CoA hydrolase
MLLDTDHIRGVGGDWDFVWESFVLGYNSIYMDHSALFMN